MTTEERQKLAGEIVADLLKEMNGRRGFRQNWDGIDADVREEIIAAWRVVVVNRLEAAEV